MSNNFTNLNGPEEQDDPITFDICASWHKKYPDGEYKGLAIGLCASDYVLCSNGVILFFILAWQLYNYRWIYKVPTTDKRIAILIICLFSTFYSAIRYGSFISVWKEKTFILVEIFRFIIFFADCYYFTSKSSNLLPNKEHVKFLL